MNATTRVAGALAVRNLRNIRRIPAAFFPALLMPIFQMIAFSGTFYAVTRIPGFPTDRSINWFLPLGVCMGSAFSGIGIGFSAIRDLETGFYDRLRMTPSPRAALLLGPLISAWVRTLIVIATVVAIGLVAGARPASGVWAIIPLLIAGLALSTVGVGWALGLAFRFRDMRGAAIMQLSVFLTLFLTSAQTPLDVMQGWLRQVARLNPFTYVLDMSRQGFLEGSAWDTTVAGVAAAAPVAALTLIFAWRGLAHLDR